jgi:hypothetical protein
MERPIIEKYEQRRMQKETSERERERRKRKTFTARVFLRLVKTKLKEMCNVRRKRANEKKTGSLRHAWCFN